MSEKNIIVQIKQASKPHLDNVTVVKLLEKLGLAIDIVNANPHNTAFGLVDPMDNYRRACNGEEGYSLLENPTLNDHGMCNPHTFMLYEVAVIAECLVLVLKALGEKF